MNRTSTSLVFSRLVSICHRGLMSQLMTDVARAWLVTGVEFKAAAPVRCLA
jgi:hypothetical protein